jgi:hypothetical protein
VNIRVLPEEVLLARLPIYQYRAWSRAWAQAQDALFQQPSLLEEGCSSIALLTGTPLALIERALASAPHWDSLLMQLAPDWVRRAHEKDDRCRVSTLPGGAVGVEIPVDGNGLREWLLRRKQQAPALNEFVTQDLQLLCQLQIAIEHAASDESVLITGETGTGKGMLAQAIHKMSGRGSFSAINCSAIPANLLEGELFGHKKDAFTGATRDKQGLVAMAGAGTLFLDEVGELAVGLQPKLLRMLREREYRPVGGNKTEAERTQARFIAATNASLLDEVAGGRFREDLLQRLSACHIELPALSERPGDILLIAEHVLKANGHSGVMTEPVRTLLVRYIWPGNVAELSGAMRYASVSAKGKPLRVSHLPDALVEEAYPPQGTASQIFLTAQVLSTGDTETQDTFPESLDAVIEESLKAPPPIANNEELDQLVVSFVQLAFMWPGNPVPLTAVNIQRAIGQLRAISLLSELRQLAQQGRFSRAVEATLEARLHAELEDVKGPPLLGMAIHILMQLFDSDDPVSRPELHRWALKFQKAAPMIVHVAQALQKSTQSAEKPAVRAIVPQPVRSMNFVKAQGTRDWMDSRNRAIVVQAVRMARGVKSQAATFLKIRSSSYIAKVIRAHGLTKLCDELIREGRSSKGQSPRPSGGNSRKKEQRPSEE